MGMAKVNWAPVELEVPDLNSQLACSLYQWNGFTLNQVKIGLSYLQQMSND